MPILSCLLLRLRLLYLVHVFCDSSAICVFGSSIPSASFVSCPLRLRLCLLCYAYIGSSATPSASASAMPMSCPHLLWLVRYLCTWVVCLVYVLCALSAPSASTVSVPVPTFSSYCVTAIGLF